MTSGNIRNNFLEFFKSKQHHIVPSAPIVVKNDPTLMFTNAGMNQFKDYFLGNKPAPYPRIADTQKCLRVSGKHNDLEEVGVDTYHHTMFEMLGNWSFGDYFKKEAIEWSWEFLTKVLNISKDRLYVTVFGGDEKEGLPKDEEAASEWRKWINEEKILSGSKKDNFWEMGDTGPCGPCTEIHFDSRTDEERKKTDGKTLVNAGHPQVIEIWNVVFIQFNRLKDGSLQQLPAKHVDTGMGFERLVRVIQGKQSNYDTDVFTGTIKKIEVITGQKYKAHPDPALAGQALSGGKATNTQTLLLEETANNTGTSKSEVRAQVTPPPGEPEGAAIAFRVLADHIRAISFTIADGQLPSNTGAGYVIRRILRRAVRYYYSYLNYQQPLLFQLVSVIAKQFENVFPELHKQEQFVTKVIREEEEAFLRTLEKGLKRIEAILSNSTKTISGKDAFELYDTYGFPFDLTRLIASEKNLTVDEAAFNAEMQKQKERSRAATAIDTEDWIIVKEGNTNEFVGYDSLQAEARILKYRKIKAKGKEAFQIVLNKTPFYAESGGQVGDTGEFILPSPPGEGPGVRLKIVDTRKENDLIIHFAEKLPTELNGKVIAKVDEAKRKSTAIHHSATHLLHAALRKVLGTHVAQKGSLVNADYLRFDFSHFSKMSDEEMKQVEQTVNEKIRENIAVVVRYMPKEEAMKTGAMALFGEKYGDVVRVIIIDPNYSIELCGGTHVGATGELGFFKIISESAIAAGVRRIEAVSGAAAEKIINEQLQQFHQIKEALKNPKDVLKSLTSLSDENASLKKQVEKFEQSQLKLLSHELVQKVQSINGSNFIGEVVEVPDADALKKLAFGLKQKIKNSVIALASAIDGKASVVLLFDDAISQQKNLDAAALIKQKIASIIKGGGGGQKTLATAGGQDSSDLSKVIETVKALL